MREVVIVDAVRTALGRRKGSLAGTRPDDLAASVLEAVVDRSGIDPAEIGDIIFGCVTQVEEQGWNITRLAALSAGIPESVPATTINRMCGSGQQAIHFASQAILSGDIDVALAGGVENMSRVAMGSDGKDFSPRLLSKYSLVWQGESAELLAGKWSLTRADIDEYSYESHQRALKAIDEERFVGQIVPISLENGSGNGKFDRDEGPRADTSVEKLSALKPAFKSDGIVTAGNASQISDGAAALLLATPEKANELGLRARARILARVVVGSDPIIMLDGIIPATRKTLEKAGLDVSDIDHFEVNEAFAVPVLAWLQEFGVDRSKVNPAGGAIALGHPLGASGARIMTTMLNELERTGGRYGLQTMCVAHGMATASVIERL